MKKSILAITLFILGISYLTAQIQYGKKELKGWELIWSDEFEYSGAPDKSKWTCDTIGNSWGWGNNEAQWYTFDEIKNARVDNGILRISALKEDHMGKKYTSARLMTKNKGDWKYGRIDVAAKLPKGKGTWPAIWMLPTDRKGPKWPDCGEIDIMEHIGAASDSVFSTVHTGKYNHMIGTQVGTPLWVHGAVDGFHVYTLEWEAHELRSYVDGKLYFTFRNENKTSAEWPFDREFHLILNLAIGGGLGGPVDDSVFPQHYDIDYVRVYKQKTEN